MTDPDPSTGPPIEIDPPVSLDTAPRRSPKRWVAIGAVAALAVGAGTFAITSMNSPAGADSPDAAVEAFFDAVEKEDAIGVLAAVEPGERDAIRRALDGTVENTDRAKITSNVNLDKVEGVDFQVHRLEYASTNLTDSIAAVDFTDGVMMTNVDMAELPFGQTVRSVIGDNPENPGGKLADLSELRLMTVKNDGRWYVSGAYTAAEAIRRNADPQPPLPAFDGGPPAVGADSPENAVRDLAQALDDMDIAAMIGLTSPTRARVLHDYNAALVAAADNPNPDDFSIKDLKVTTSDGPGGSKTVAITQYEMTMISGEYDSYTYRLADGCITTTNLYEDSDTGGIEQSWNTCDETRPEQPLFLPIFTFGSQTYSGIEFTVVSENGRWFIDPFETLGSSLVAGLENTSTEILQRTAQFWAGATWVTYPDEFWEACGVSRPATDANQDEGAQAVDDCIENLPEDYEGFGGHWESDSEESDGEMTDDSGRECYTTGEPEVTRQCLQEGVDDGTIDPAVLAMFDCNAKMPDEPTDAEFEELDRCMAEARKGS